MSEPLYPYYERELVFIRQLGQEFARQYPAAARRLLIEQNQSNDPHVERLIESFALIAGRIHHKLDDEFPELTEALLNVLYPHYLAPIPSMALVQFDLDPTRAQLPAGFRIERHSRLHSAAVNGVPCRFRTGYPVTLWPVGVATARLAPPPFPQGLRPPDRTKAVLTLDLECRGELKFAELELDRLRFYLASESQLVPALYELLFNHTLRVAFRPLERDSRAATVTLDPAQCLFPVGFERDEGLLPYPNQSFLGYRLLTEFFVFPSKFHFLDLSGFRQAARAGFERRMQVVFYLDRTLASLEQSIDAGTFRLGCAPIINLLEEIAQPIALTQARYEYRVAPTTANADGMEVYSVDAVTSVNPTSSTTTEYQPFYSFRHGKDRANQKAYWYASRRPSLRKDDRGTEVYLNLVDLGFDPRLPADTVLIVRTTCTNRDLPTVLQHAGEELYLELEAMAPLARIRCVRSPTTPLRLPLERGAHWRLLSHLNLNHLSLSDPVEGRDALQEVLSLYDYLAPTANQVITGINSVNSRRVVGRTGGPAASGFARGMEVTIEFEEQNYVGTGAFLFACVLERFLGLYASINSFTQLDARIKPAAGPVKDLKKWPPRAAERTLL